MRSLLKRHILYSILLFLFFIGIEKTYGMGEEYTLYEQKVESACKDILLPWQSKESGNIGISVPKYRELDSSLLSEEKRLLMSKIGEGSSTWKNSDFFSLSIAESSYRDAMNKTFSCGIVHSRLKILTTLRETIEKRVGVKKTEIIRKLDSEKKRLEIISGNVGCNPNGSDESVAISTKVINTATLQYCTYTLYLEYIQKEVIKSVDLIEKVESELRKKEGSQEVPPITANELNNASANRSNMIQEAQIRAAGSIGRAFDSYKEMTQTYGVHLMLVILYDDYVRLRDNLAGYFDIVSQTFEKAKNAQSK